MTLEQLSAIDGIGPERSDAISRELRSQSAFLDELLNSVDLITTKGGLRISAPTICFTGKMPEQRSYYENLARKSGYEPADAVTKELSLLVAADLSSASSKLDKARSYGVKTQSLEDWLKMQIPNLPTAKAPLKKAPETPDLFDFGKS